MEIYKHKYTVLMRTNPANTHPIFMLVTFHSFNNMIMC